jgi:hypothetical protein
VIVAAFRPTVKYLLLLQAVKLECVRYDHTSRYQPITYRIGDYDVRHGRLCGLRDPAVGKVGNSYRAVPLRPIVAASSRHAASARRLHLELPLFDVWGCTDGGSDQAG